MRKYIWDKNRVSDYLEHLNTVTNNKVYLKIIQFDKGKYPIELTSDCESLVYIPQFLNHESFFDQDIEAMLIFCYSSAIAQINYCNIDEKTSNKDYFQNTLQDVCKSADRELVTIEYLDKIVTPVRKAVFTLAEDKSYYSVGDIIRHDLCRYTITAIFEENGNLKITFEGDSPFKLGEHVVHTELEDTVHKYFTLVDRKEL